MSRAAVAAAGALTLASALAQGGPPMVTDDPETPGDGHWEINVGAIAARTAARRELAAPDADINYGWGDHVQLKLDVPWVTARDDGQHAKSGLGDADLGVKWRFIDQEQSGYAMSIYPQYTRSVLDSSVRRGLASEGHALFLPVEFSTEWAGTGIAAEIGRNLVSDGGPNEWVAGVVAAHGCGENRECMVEARTTQANAVHLTLLNVGMHWKLNDSVTLLGAVGREFGTRTDERLQSLVYLGVQINR